MHQKTDVMRKLRALWMRLQGAFGMGCTDTELDAELETHLQMHIDDAIRAGLNPKEARRQALIKLGGLEQTRTAYRAQRGLPFLESLVRDLRYAARQLRRRPGFTVTAVVTLALGIGANAAIFTLIHATLLQNLPVPHPEQLIRVGDDRHGGISWFSTEMYDQLRKNTPEFQQLAAMQASSPDNSWLTLRRQGVAEIPHGEISEWVSGNYFAMMGIGPARGRLLEPADDVEGAPMVAVISYSTWQREYAADPAIVGSVLVINTHPVTVVGIAPKEFYGDRITAYPTELFLPLSTESLLGESDYSHNHTPWLYLLGRIKPGVALGPLQAKMHALLIPSLRTIPYYSGAAGEERIKRHRLSLTPGNSGIAAIGRDMVAGLHLLLWISGLVLLIACANIANLVLARGLARRGEIAVRVALGAERARIVRQMLTESILLSCIGGVAGLLVAYEVSAMMLKLAFPHAEVSPIHAAPSPQVLAFSFVVSLLTGLLFGIAPAWVTSHAQPADVLRGSTRTTSGQASRLQRSLVVLQASLSLVLLIGAGLLSKSLLKLQHQNFGIQVEQRVVVRLNTQNARYTTEQLQPLYDRMRASMLSLRGVTQAGMALFAPLDGDDYEADVVVEGSPGPHDEVISSWDRVSPELFDAVGQHLVRGRGILATDTANSPGVAVVNQAFVKRFFPNGEDPIGQHFGSGSKSAGDWAIVGVVENAKYQHPRGQQEPMFFLALLQRAKSETQQEYAGETSSLYIGSIILVTNGAGPGLEQQVRQALENINPNLNVNNYETLEAQIGDQLSQQKLLARLTLLFGLLALTLAGVGLYGVTAYTVAQRVSEIGIRMALGAKRGDIVWMVLQGTMLQAGLGLAIGVPAALLCARFVQSQLFEVGGGDLGVITASIGTLALAAGVAGIVPSRRAARIDPVKALRSE